MAKLIIGIYWVIIFDSFLGIFMKYRKTKGQYSKKSDKSLKIELFYCFRFFCSFLKLNLKLDIIYSFLLIIYDSI